MSTVVRVQEKVASILLRHRRAERLLDARIDQARGESPLGPADGAWLAAHLGACARCREAASRREVLEASMRALRGEKAPPGFAGRVLFAARVRKHEAPQEESPRPLLAMSQIAAGGLLLALVLVGVGVVIGVAPKLGTGKVESFGSSVALDSREAPDFTVRSPGTGVAKVRSQVTAIVLAHGGKLTDEDRAIVARIPRGELIGVTQDLANQGRYKMSKSGEDSELRPSADTIIIRFELE